MPFHTIDLHCDLLSYLQDAPNPNPSLETREIGCHFPALREGNVKLQVMAIYTATERGSTELAVKQSVIFKEMLVKFADQITLVADTNKLNAIKHSQKIGIVAAIENASGFCEEDEPLDAGLKRLEQLIGNAQRLLYIGLTHNIENRFGGGNASKVGLKDDGKILLDYISKRKIALDFSHTSDALAYGILDYILKNNLGIPIIASHSNYRKIWGHARNLPDEIAQEIIRNKGLIGINFLRFFINESNPDAIYDHIQHGLNFGGEHAICFGADYFYTDSHPDKSRLPFFFKEQESAACYPDILSNIVKQFSQDIAEKISSNNVLEFINRIWK